MGLTDNFHSRYDLNMPVGVDFPSRLDPGFQSTSKSLECQRFKNLVSLTEKLVLPGQGKILLPKIRYNLSLVNTENLATTEFDPQLAVVFDIRCRSTKGNEKSPNVSQDRVNWTSTMADRILPVGNGGVLGSSKSMSKMRVNPYRDRAKSFYQRYVANDNAQSRKHPQVGGETKDLSSSGTHRGIRPRFHAGRRDILSVHRPTRRRGISSAV